MLRNFSKLFSKSVQPFLYISELQSYEAYNHHTTQKREKTLADWSFEKSLVSDNLSEFSFKGFCYVCDKCVKFKVDYQYHYKVNGITMPNWRERLICPRCQLNNRMRATIQIFVQKYNPHKKSSIYLTEQTTLLYKWFEKKYDNVCGSEYLGTSTDYGNINDKGMRNEDLTQLSFSKDRFDYILSFDVFEHIPDYKKALTECYRCLKPGGTLYFSVPFIATEEKNIIRAQISDSGELIHLLPPEYHGNPISSDGCLSFYHFGWELLEDLRILGFVDAKALFYWSREMGYLGGEQLIFAATKNSELSYQ